MARLRQKRSYDAIPGVSLGCREGVARVSQNACFMHHGPRIMEKQRFATPVRPLCDPSAIGGVSQLLAIYTSAYSSISGFAIPKIFFLFPSAKKYFFRHIGVAVIKRSHA